MEKEIEKLQELIDSSNRIVFFGGAGAYNEPIVFCKLNFCSFHMP